MLKSSSPKPPSRALPLQYPAGGFYPIDHLLEPPLLDTKLRPCRWQGSGSVVITLLDHRGAVDCKMLELHAFFFRISLFIQERGTFKDDTYVW